MAGVSFTSLSAWAWELGMDTHSIGADPQFVSAAAADFHVQSTSPTVDAGNPASEFAGEPAPNGGRINLGYDGNTAQAATSSSATTVQVTSPTALQKLQVGQPDTIGWLSTGLLSTQTITEVAAGESTPVGEYHADEFQVVAHQHLLDQQRYQYQPGRQPRPASGLPDLRLRRLRRRQLPLVPDSRSRRHLHDPPGLGRTVVRFGRARTFDVMLQGQVVQPAFDVYNAAGRAMYKAVALTFTVTASGGSGIAWS